jgi:hypothetical protein
MVAAMTHSGDQRFQFGLRALFCVTTLIAVGIASWSWLPWELRLVFGVPLVLAASIAILVFAQALILWLVIWLSARIARFFQKRRHFDR